MRAARHLARCSICRESAPWLAGELRALPTVTLTTAERHRLWQAIRAEVEAEPGWRVPAILPWLRGLRRRRPMLAWAPVVAAAILLLLAPLHLGREQLLSQAELNAQTSIERVEAGPSSSLLLLDTPTERLSVIWVMEPQ